MPHKPTLLVLLLGSRSLRVGGIQLRRHAAAGAAAAAAAVGDRARASPASPARRRSYAVPDFIALSPDPETAAAAKTIASGALGRPRLRARVLPDSARHLRVDSTGALARRRAVRSLARARRRRSRHRHRAEDRPTAFASRCGCSTSRSRQSVFDRGVQRPGRATRASTRTRCPTRSTSSSARCAAWRARS